MCNICHKISATDKDHTDCIQKKYRDGRWEFQKQYY